METILVVDDDRLTRTMIRESLESRKFCVIEAVNAERAIDILEHHKVGLVLLDLYLNEGKSTDHILPIINKSQSPLIVVSGEQETAARIEALNNGANDFVTKPFNVDELVARIHAHIRSPSAAKSESVNGEKPVFKFDGWSLDAEQFQAFDEDMESLNLNINEFEILHLLIKNAGRPVLREALGQAVAKGNYIPSPRAIDIKITRLRKKLHDDAADPKIIKTVRGVGYIFALNQQEINECTNS